MKKWLILLATTTVCISSLMVVNGEPRATSHEQSDWLEIETDVGIVLVKPKTRGHAAVVLTNALKQMTDAENDAEKMTGTWRCVWHQRDGKANPDKQVGTLYIFGQNVMFHREKNGTLISRWEYSVSQTASTKQINHVGIDSDSVYNGIYWLQGDTLVIRESKRDKPSPTHFDEGTFLTVLQRQIVHER